MARKRTNSAPFQLRSGNRSPYNMMGSSPIYDMKSGSYSHSFENNNSPVQRGPHMQDSPLHNPVSAWLTRTVLKPVGKWIVKQADDVVKKISGRKTTVSSKKGGGKTKTNTNTKPKTTGATSTTSTTSGDLPVTYNIPEITVTSPKVTPYSPQSIMGPKTEEASRLSKVGSYLWKHKGKIITGGGIAYLLWPRGGDSEVKGCPEGQMMQNGKCVPKGPVNTTTYDVKNTGAQDSLVGIPTGWKNGKPTFD